MAGQQDPTARGLSAPSERQRRLPRSFFARPVLEVAPDLLGCRVSHAGVTVRLTEVEAYDGERDPGSHAYRGPTPRTRVMFGRPGGLYVYFSYGMHYCCNLVCGEEGRASAVLLRAGEVVAGVDLARSRRGAARDRSLARGPACLTQALAVARPENGLDVAVDDSPMAVLPREPAVDGAGAPKIATGPRVGVSGAGGDGTAYPWRFWLEDEATVSAYRPGGKPRPRRTERPG